MFSIFGFFAVRESSTIERAVHARIFLHHAAHDCDRGILRIAHAKDDCESRMILFAERAQIFVKRGSRPRSGLKTVISSSLERAALG